MRRILASLLASLVVSGLSNSRAADGLSFTPVGTNEFTFQTGRLQGKLGGGGKTKGLSSVVHTQSGMRVDSSMGLLSHYRVFTRGKRYGVGAWDWPGTMNLRPDGSVETEWPKSDDRPFAMTAKYRIAGPEFIDLETTVLPETNLAGFEVFVASYFTPSFTNASVWVRGASGPTLVAAEQKRGAWQAFPRDQEAVRLIQDGRWKLEPNPVEWLPLEKLQNPLGVRRAPAKGVTAVLMAPSTDCFAICTPYQDEAHYSMYLSLFGRDIKAGETATAKIRLVIGSDFSPATLQGFYAGYTKSASE